MYILFVSAADFSRGFLFSRGAMNLGVAVPAPGSEEIAPREIGEAREVYILIVSAADFSCDFLFSRGAMNLGWPCRLPVRK